MQVRYKCLLLAVAHVRMRAGRVCTVSKFAAVAAIDCAYTEGELAGQEQNVTERFQRHRQAWTYEELEQLKLLARKGMALKAISKAMTRSEESIKDRAKQDGMGIAKLR